MPQKLSCRAFLTAVAAFSRYNSIIEHETTEYSKSILNKQTKCKYDHKTC